MQTISMFYDLPMSMYFMDTAKHNSQHVHSPYQDQRAVFGIPEGHLLVSKLPPKQGKLMADSNPAIESKEVVRINPLK